MSQPTRLSNLLEGKVAVVSGIGPGLGRRAALALASHGCSLALGARRQSSLDDVAGELKLLGANVVASSTDITKRDECERLVALAVDELGGIDIVVNNAFRFDIFQPFENADLAEWAKISETNIFGSLSLTQAALPALRQRGGGSVIMVASLAARKPPALQGGYAISKGGLLSATRVLATELGSSGIRVNAVVPGWMMGPSVEIYIEMTSKQRKVDRQVIIDELAVNMPLGRIPSDEEVAGTIVYLASDLSLAITGQAIDANGGELMV